jgi:hypothetical protein
MMRQDSIDREYTTGRGLQREPENSATAYEEQCSMRGDVVRALRAQVLEGGMGSYRFPSHCTASPGDSAQALGKRSLPTPWVYTC